MGAAALSAAGTGMARAQSAQPLYRVHCGGEAFVDAAGHFWDADMRYEGGNVFGSVDSIVGTPDQALYKTERWNDPAAGSLRYTFDVRDGAYNVKLHFAEIWDGAYAVGSRVFDVNVNGMEAAKALDIFARAGARTPLVLEQPAHANNGKITVEFFNQAGHAKISGIEVLPVSPFRADKAPYRIHCGGDDFIDAQGNYWEADGHFTGGFTYVTANAVGGTDKSLLYQTERFNGTGDLTYVFPVDEGSYTVRLHFAEIFFSTAGSRVFGIDINGLPAADNVDIAAEAGPNVAVIKEFGAPAQEGKIVVSFRNVVENAKVSGIEILPGLPVKARSAAKASRGAPGRSGVRKSMWIAPGQAARDVRGKRLPINPR